MRRRVAIRNSFRRCRTCGVLPALVVALGLASVPAQASTGNGSYCDENIAAPPIPALDLTSELLEKLPAPGEFLEPLGAAADSSSVPLLFLTPRLLGILEDIFAEGAVLPGDTQYLPSPRRSPLAGTEAEQPVILDQFPDDLNPDVALPSYQLQMYRTDI